MGGLRRVHADGCCTLELLALALDECEPLLVRKGAEIAVAELLAVPPDRVHRRVVGGQDRCGAADDVAELAEEFDVRVGLRPRIG